MRALGFVTSSLDVSKRRNKDHSRDTKIGIMLTSSAAPTRTARKLRCGTPRNRSPPSSLQMGLAALLRRGWGNGALYGCKRQIRLRRTDSGLGTLWRPGIVAATDSYL